MTEEEFLRREQCIESEFRDGMITLEEKRKYLEDLIARWEAEAE